MRVWELQWMIGEVTHLAKAISVRDLQEQVALLCPPGS